MFLERISNFLLKNRKKIFFYGFFTVFIFMSSGDISFAAFTEEDVQSRVKFINGILAGLGMIVGVITYLVTLLLDPSFTSGHLFGIDVKLHQLWILVSNVVYFVFAFILIWIAFMNIIGKGDKWELKQAMPKFIVGVLIVPFSWFIVSLVVSLANILTIAALSLPSDSFPEFKSKIDGIDIPLQCDIDLSQGSSSDKGTSGGTSPAKSAESWIDCSKGGKVKLGELIDSSVFGLVTSYTYGLLHVDTMGKVSNNAIIDAIKTIEDLIVYVLFNSLFLIVYMILIITLAIVLLVRAIYLWIYMALSPLFGLAYFFGKDSGGDLFKKFNFGEFVSLAMVPVYTMLALSFGFVFITVATNGLTQENGGGQKTNGIETDKYNIDKDGITIKFLDREGTNKDVRLNIKGGGVFANMMDTTTNFTGDFFSSQLGVVGAIFMNVFGIMIFRIAIMAALQSSSITKEIVAPIKQFGDSVGSLVAKAPTYAPVFGGKSATELGQAASTLQGSVQSYYSGKGSKLGSSFADKMGFSESDIRKHINDFRTQFVDFKHEGSKKMTKQLLRDLVSDNISENDFKDILLQLKEKGFFKKDFDISKIKYGDRKNIETFAQSLSNSQSQKSKQGFGSYLDDSNDFQDLLKTGAINVVKGDGDNKIRTGTTVEGFKKFNGKVEVDNNIKIKLNEEGAKYGKGEVAILNKNESGYEIIEVNFNRTDKDATEFVGDDIKEAIELYGKIGDQNKFAEVLKGLGFDRNKVAALAKQIKEKYEKV